MYFAPYANIPVQIFRSYFAFNISFTSLSLPDIILMERSELGIRITP